jgi:PAS domain S-box-containing protein
MADTLERLTVHDHCCLIHESRQEQLAALVPFVCIGLERREKCLWIVGETPEEVILEALRGAGVDVEAATGVGRLILAGSRDTYLKQGFFDPDRMINDLETLTDAAVAAGFSALRVTGEMSWALRETLGVERLLEYESKLAHFFAARPCLGICQYDRRFPAETLLGVIRTHPLIIHQGMLWQNFYYVPPEEFLLPNQAQREVDQLLKNIQRRGQVEDALRRARDELEIRVRERTAELEQANQLLQAEIAQRRRTMEALEASEQRYRHLFDGANDIIFTLDLEGHLTSANRAAERISGYTREEIVRLGAAGILTRESLERGLRMLRAKLGGLEWTTYELPVVAKDGRRLTLELNTRLWFQEGRPAGVLGIGRDVTERKHAEQELRHSEAALQRSHEQLRALAGSLLTAQEEERTRLSCELHDDLNQKLAMLAVEVEALEQRLPPSADFVQSRLRLLRNRVAELSDDVRRIAYELHPSIIEHLGLAVALKSYCAEFGRRTGIRVKFIRRDGAAAVPHDVALCLYRVAQEGLGNVAKHSGSSRATVVLSVTPRGLHLSISDFGVGFDAEQVKGKGGLGLISMGERVRLVNGGFEVRSRPKRGTRLDVRIPLVREVS